MKIQKYKAKIINSETFVVGYICPLRQMISPNSYSEKTDYLITVNVTSMPNDIDKWGCFFVDPDSIEIVI